MQPKKVLKDLKNLNLSKSHTSLIVIREYKQNRSSRYILKFVKIEDNLQKRLKSILRSAIEKANTVEAYTFDCPEPEGDEVRAIDYSETDFHQIFEQLDNLNPEDDVVEDLNELVQSKAYLISLSNKEGIQAVGFRKIPENWKMKRDKGLISLLFKENRFEGLEEENIFSIASNLDMFYYDETLFILSKKSFEQALNFRLGMEAKAEEMYAEAEQREIFSNIEVLKEKVGNNQRFLRKIATIKNLGHYNNRHFLSRFQELNVEKQWNIQFKNNQICLTPETVDSILTILQNKRLHSQFTGEDFDVDSAKRLE